MGPKRFVYWLKSETTGKRYCGLTSDINARLAALAARELALLDAEVTHVSLVDYPMPIYDGDIEKKEGPPERARAFKALAERQINIRAISTSEIKFSLLIDADAAELAVRRLHSLYGLDK